MRDCDERKRLLVEKMDRSVELASAVRLRGDLTLRCLAPDTISQHMQNKLSACHLMQACLDFGEQGSNAPGVYIIQHDTRDPVIKAKSTAYLFALRSILASPALPVVNHGFLTELLKIPFSIYTLIKVFDADMRRIMAAIPDQRDDANYEYIHTFAYPQVLKWLANPANSNYSDTNRQALASFLGLQLQFLPLPVHPARIISHFYPLLVFSNNPVSYLDEIGQMDDYAPEIRWLMKRMVEHHHEIGSPNQSLVAESDINHKLYTEPTHPFRVVYPKISPIYWSHHYASTNDTSGFLDKTNVEHLLKEIRALRFPNDPEYVDVASRICDEISIFLLD